MQQLASWKFPVLTGLLQLFFLVTPAVSATDDLTVPTAGSDAAAYLKYGMANGARGDLDTAIQAFNEALRIDPKYAPAYYNRGYAYAIENNLNEAVSNFDQAIQIDPGYAAAYYQRGTIRGQKGDFNGALSDFSKVIDLRPKFAAAYYNKGHVHYFQGDLEDAMAEVNQALSLDANFPFSYFIRGLIRHSGEDPEAAISDFKKSAGLGFPTAYLWVWICQTESGQRGIATKELADALKQPDAFKSDEWSKHVAAFLLKKISENQLLSHVKEGTPADMNSRLCEAWFFIGMSRRFTGDVKGAQDAFTRAVATQEKGSEEFVEANRQLAQSPGT